MKARVWGGAVLLLAACATSTGCSAAVEGALVGHRSSAPVTVTATGTTATTPSGPPNLLANGTFEAGIAPWQPVQPYSRIGVTGKARFGRKALLAIPTSAGVPRFGAQALILTGPPYGASYWARAWTRSARGTSVHATLFVVKRVASGWQVVVLATRTRRSRGGWQRLSLRGDVKTRRASTLELQISVAGTVKAWSRLAVDGVEVESVPPLKPHKKRPAGHKKSHG